MGRILGVLQKPALRHLSEWFAKGQVSRARRKSWHQINGKNYALRVRGLVGQDGRPMTPPQKNGTATGPKKSYLQMPDEH